MPPDLANILTAVALVITALASLVSAIVGFINTQKINAVQVTADENHAATNSLKDELVESTREQANLRGNIEGRAAQKADDAAAAAAATESIAAEEGVKPHG